MKTQTKLLLIRIAGVVSILFTLFHAGFFWLFKWSQALSVLNTSDRGILLTFNLICIMLLLYSVILSLGYTRQLIGTIAGKSILLFFTAFYLVRIYSEFAYFGFRMPSSIFIIAICLIPTVSFGLSVFVKSK